MFVSCLSSTPGCCCGRRNDENAHKWICLSRKFYFHSLKICYCDMVCVVMWIRRPIHARIDVFPTTDSFVCPNYVGREREKQPHTPIWFTKNLHTECSWKTAEIWGAFMWRLKAFVAPLAFEWYKELPFNMDYRQPERNSNSYNICLAAFDS